MKHLIGLLTFGSEEEARKISLKILEGGKLAACVNIVPVNSMYWWEGKIADDREYLAVVKTTETEVPGIIDLVKREHSYQLPEIIFMPVDAGSGEYLDWIDRTVNSKAKITDNGQNF